MDDNNRGREEIYEIGYLIVGSMAEENIFAEADKIKRIIIDAGATIISEEAPRYQRLAYTIQRKTVTGSYEKYNEAHFGWVKFEIGTDKIETIKKTIEIMPSVLRMLLIATVRENTYLGKRAPTAVVSALDEKHESRRTTTEFVAPEVVTEATVAHATVEEIDKSIDEMVKEA